VHIRLIPKPDTRFARQFKVIDTFVDPKQNMPARIVTENPETKRTADLSNVQINPVLTNQDFELEKVDLTGWNISEGAYQDRPSASNGNKK
jgi:outer membrane lipoprotein-sorting protein